MKEDDNNMTALDMYAAIIAGQYCSVTTAEDATFTISPQLLLMKLCTAEAPTTSRIDEFILLLYERGIFLQTVKAENGFELLYLLKEKCSSASSVVHPPGF